MECREVKELKEKLHLPIENSSENTLEFTYSFLRKQIMQMNLKPF